MRVGVGIERVVHVLQHVFNADLFTITNAPNRTELESLDDCRLEDEDGCGARTRDEVDALRIKLWNRLRKDAVVPRVEHSDAIRTDESAPITLASVEDALFEFGSGFCLFTESSGDDNESTDTFLGSQHIYIVGAETCRDDKDGQLGFGDVVGVVIGFDALNLFFLGIHDAQQTLVSTADEISNDGTSRLVCVIRASDDNNALGLQQLSVNHRRF